jgi:hypothetical protein
MKIEHPFKNGYISSSGGLLATAKRAYHRAAREGNHPTETLDNSLTAVLMACAALEGYINESFALIREGPGMKKCPERAKAFADILQEAEDSRGSTRLKYQMGLAVLTGKPFAKGTPPYQDFDLLFSIRDELMHHKLEKLTEEPHKLVKRLRSKHLCADDAGVKQSWHGLVFTPATAKWACNTAVHMINTIQAALFQCADEDSTVTPLKLWSAITQSKIE